MPFKELIKSKFIYKKDTKLPIEESDKIKLISIRENDFVQKKLLYEKFSMSISTYIKSG